MIIKYRCEYYNPVRVVKGRGGRGAEERGRERGEVLDHTNKGEKRGKILQERRKIVTSLFHNSMYIQSIHLGSNMSRTA